MNLYVCALEKIFVAAPRTYLCVFRCFFQAFDRVNPENRVHEMM